MILRFENRRLSPVSPYVGVSTNGPQTLGRRNREKAEFCPRPFFSILLGDRTPVPHMKRGVAYGRSLRRTIAAHAPASNCPESAGNRPYVYLLIR